MGTLLPILGPESLGRQSAGSHAYEAAIPVDEIEDRDPDGQGPDRGRRVLAVPMTGNGGRCNTHERNGDVGDDVGHRNPQNFPIHGHKNSRLNQIVSKTA